MSQANAANSSALSDPLLKALVDKLPMPGSPFPAAERANWLRMWVMALNSAYGVSGAVEVSEWPAESRRLTLLPPGDDDSYGGPAGGSMQAASAAAPALSAEGNEAVAEAKRASSRAGKFIVDEEGFALRDGSPFAPEDVPAGTPVFDYRVNGERGDVTTVFWKGSGIRKPSEIPGIELRAA